MSLLALYSSAAGTDSLSSAARSLRFREMRLGGMRHCYLGYLGWLFFCVIRLGEQFCTDTGRIAGSVS